MIGTKTIKRTLAAALALFLAAVSAIDTPVRCFAEVVGAFDVNNYTPQQLEEVANGTRTTPVQLYISDLMIANSEDSPEEAKAILHDAGYAVYDANLNKGAGDDNPWVGFGEDEEERTRRYTYIGYKVTDKREEGITGISAMDQMGGYDSFDYRDIVRQGMPGFPDLVESTLSVITEFKARYNEGDEAALVAKKQLDLFCVPKTSKETTGTPLGDYLLDANRTQTKIEDMLLIMNGLILGIVNELLCLGVVHSSLDPTEAYMGYTDNTTWLTDALDAVVKSEHLSTINVAGDKYWLDINRYYQKEAVSLQESYISDANETARNYLSALPFELTISSTTYNNVDDFIRNAPTRAVALFASKLPQVALDGRFADILNRFAASPDEGIPAGLYTSYNAVVSYDTLVENDDWLQAAYNAAMMDTEIASIHNDDSLYWLGLEKHYGAVLTLFREAAADGTLSAAAVDYLSRVTLVDTNAYEFLTKGSERLGYAFLAALLDELSVAGWFADVINSTAATDDGTNGEQDDPAAGIAANNEWIVEAYKTAMNDKEMKNINVAESVYWCDMEKRHGKAFDMFRSSASDGTLTADAAKLLRGITVTDGAGSTNMYTFLTEGSKRKVCAFFAALEEKKHAIAATMDRYFTDMVEICATDCRHRVPSGLVTDPHYECEWAEDVVESINANPYSESTKKEMYDLAQDFSTELDSFGASLNTFVTDYKAAKGRVDATGSLGLEKMSDKKSKEELDSLLNGDTDASKVKMPDYYYISLGEILKGYQLDDGTDLLDYLIRVNDAFEADDTEKAYVLAYPFVGTLSAGKRFVYKTNSFSSFLTSITTSEYEVAVIAASRDYESKLFRDAFKSDRVSIWYATNKELTDPDEFVAITNENVRAAIAEDQLDKLWDNPPDYLECYKVLKTTWEIALGVVNFTLLMMIPFLGKIAGVGFVGMLTAVFSSAAAAGGAAAAATTAVVCTVISTVLVAITIIVVVVLLVVALIYLILYLVDYYSHPYSDQPTIMLDSPSKPTAKNFKDIVIKYYAVRGPDGKPADVNGLNGKKWTTLYYTKDSRLGSPLVKGPNGKFFFDQMGGIKRQDDAMPIAKFGSVSPFNMNNNCFQDTVGGHYFWYYTEESMNPAGTQSQDQKYIKNIILTYSENPSEARQAIERLSGYTVFDENLSKNNEDYCTYLGYQTTSDPKEALTDIRVSYASASKTIRYGEAEYRNIQPFDHQTLIVSTCAEAAWSKKDTNFAYGVYSSTSSLVGDPILADSLNVVEKVTDVPAGDQVISMFAGGAFDFNSWDGEGWETFKYHCFGTYRTEVQTKTDGKKDSETTAGDKQTADTTASETTAAVTTTAVTTAAETTSADTTNGDKKGDDKKDDEKTVEETYIAGFAFFSGSYDWSGAGVNPTQYAESLGYTVLEWWDPSGGYTYSNDHTYLAYVTTHDPKRALTDIGVFTSEPKSLYLPDAISTAAGGFVACQVYTQGDYWYYGANGGFRQRMMRKSHAYLSAVESEVHHYSIYGDDSGEDTWFNEITVPCGETRYSNEGRMLPLSRGLYVAGPANGKNPLRLSDIIFTFREGAVPRDGGNNGYLFYLTGEGSKTTLCGSDIGTGWKSAHALDQYYYDTYDAKGNITSSYNLSDDGRRLCIFYRNGSPDRVRGNYVANVEIVGDQTEKASFNTARIYAMAYGMDIINLDNPIHMLSSMTWDPTSAELFYELKSGKMPIYDDGAIYLTVTYTNSSKEAVGSIRIAEQTKATGRLTSSMSMPLDSTGAKTYFTRHETVAPYLAAVKETKTDEDQTKKDPTDPSKSSKEELVEGLVLYTTSNGYKTNRLSVRTIPIAASPESNGGTQNLLGRAEYYVSFGDSTDPFLLANYQMGEAFCICAERSDAVDATAIQSNFRYIESISVIEEKSFDGTIGMAAATLGASRYPFVINCDITAGSLRSGDNRVAAIGVKRTGNEKNAIKDIKISAVDHGVSYEYLDRTYTRVNEDPVNGVFIYTSKDDGSKELLGEYIDWKTVNRETTNFSKFDFMKLNWNTIDDTFDHDWTGKKSKEEQDRLAQLKEYQEQILELYVPKKTAITNLGFIPSESTDDEIFWAGCAPTDGAQSIIPITSETVVSGADTFDGTLPGIRLVYTNGVNMSYEDFIKENKKTLKNYYPSLSGSVYTDSDQLSVVILLAAVVLAGTGLAVFFGLKRKRNNTKTKG